MNFIEHKEDPKSYWCYYISLSKRKDSFRKYAGVFCMEVQNNKFEFYSDVKRKPSYWSEVIHIYRGYRRNSKENLFEMFETKEEAIQAHDDCLLSLLQNLTCKYRREYFTNKIINKTRLPGKSILEKNALKWFNTLNHDEKEYVKFFRKFYEKDL